MPIDVPILFIGDKNHPEFSMVTNWLTQRNAMLESGVAGALTRIRSGFNPTVIVVAQSWPGQISSRQIDQLRQSTPLARLVSLLGTWLEGEARTGKPWPAVWRTYWRQWLPRFAAELDRLAAGEETVWSLSATAGDDERLLYLRSLDARSSASAAVSRMVAISSPSRETAESLRDICHQHGWPTIWLNDSTSDVPKNVDLVLFDCRDLAAVEFDQIANLKFQIGDVPMVVLAGFPRIEDAQRLQAMGVAAVISKPFLVDELVWQIEQAFATSPLAA